MNFVSRFKKLLIQNEEFLYKCCNHQECIMVLKSNLCKRLHALIESSSNSKKRLAMCTHFAKHRSAQTVRARVRIVQGSMMCEDRFGFLLEGTR